MDPSCIADTIMCVETLPSRKSFEEWITPWLLALQENRIHCPGCVDQERRAHKYLSELLENKSVRTSQEELKLHRQKLCFLTCVYDEICEKAAEKRAANLQARLAANHAGRPLPVIPTAAPATTAAAFPREAGESSSESSSSAAGLTAAVASSKPIQLSAVEKELYC